MRQAQRSRISRGPSNACGARRPKKPHFASDALRYDSHGRLWVRTERGDDTRTLFDVFAVSGVFLGGVEMAGQVRHFAFNGSWMLTTGEDADGIPQVTRWRLTGPSVR